MNIRQRPRRVMLPLIGIICLVTPGSGEAQKAVQTGPVTLERSEATQRYAGPVYTLSFVEIADAKPVECIWFLQKEVVQEGEPVEVHESAFRSLAAPSLRGQISHLPIGSRICCTNRYLPGFDPATRVSINQAAGLQDFVAFCRRKNIEFVFGIPF